MLQYCAGTGCQYLQLSCHAELLLCSALWLSGAQPGTHSQQHNLAEAVLCQQVAETEHASQVHDVSAEEGEGPNFDLLDAVEYWEVPIEGGPPPDNPVPSANGARYSPPAGAAAAVPAEADADLFTTENGGGFGGPAENGHMPMVSMPVQLLLRFKSQEFAATGLGGPCYNSTLR